MTPQQRANALLRLQQLSPHLSAAGREALLDGVDRARASAALAQLTTGGRIATPPAPANSNGFGAPTALLSRVLRRGLRSVEI